MAAEVLPRGAGASRKADGGHRMTDPDQGFVHSFVKGTGGRTLILLHGTGGDEGSLLPVANLVDGAASTLGVRGKVLENGMSRFFRRFSEGVFDVEDIKSRANELADFLEWASREYGFRLSSLTAVGYSNGANMGASLLLLRPEVIRSAVLLRPTLPLKPARLPQLSGKAAFVSAGVHDPIVPQDGTQALCDLLKEAGADVTVNWEDATHALTKQELQKVRSWLASEKAPAAP
jgi:phospholipase/carboxylesterase